MRSLLLVPVLLATGCYGTSNYGGLGVDCSQQGAADAWGESTPTRVSRSAPGIAVTRIIGMAAGRWTLSVSLPGTETVLTFATAEGEPFVVGDYPHAIGGPGRPELRPAWLVSSPILDAGFTVHEFEMAFGVVARFRLSYFIESEEGTFTGCMRAIFPW
jgi:hypothetical protein